MPEDPAIKSLQTFFLSYYDKINNCKHESIYSQCPTEPNLFKETCYCGQKNILHISPKLAADLSSNSEFKGFHPDNVIEDGKLKKMFGVPIVVEKSEYFQEKKNDH